MQINERALTDAGTAVVGLSASYGINLADMASYGYTAFMGGGAALLMIGRLILMWREINAKRDATPRRRSGD